MTDNSSNEEMRKELMRASEYFNTTATANYQHLLTPQYFTQQMFYPYVNPYSHLTEANGNLAIHGYGSDGRPKFRRSRTIFNPEQLEVLEKHFEKIKYPGVKQRKRIADEIGLPEERVQIWFQNRRAKDKRQMEQQAKLQKLVDEAICGSQEENRIKGGAESEAAIAFDNPIEQQQMKVDISHPTQEACCSKQENTEYIDRKEITFPESSQQPLDRKVNCTAGPQNAWPNGSTESLAEPQVAIENIDQDLLFKVANILSASNNAAQLITEWSQSPNKLQTSNLEEQLQHFAEHHQKVLTTKANTTSNNIQQSGEERQQ